MKKSALVLGSNGMLGYDVFNALKKMPEFSNVVGLDIEDGYDFTDPDTLVDYFRHNEHFDYLINCIAYTNTSSAENSEDGKELSYELNAIVPKNLAYACNLTNTKLIHISTDWVFSQKSGGFMFAPYDTPYPVNTYGKDKLIGEHFIESEFGSNFKGYAILRVSWLYGNHNSKSFIHKFLKNTIASGKAEVEMTSNEYSIPTSTQYALECIIDSLDDDHYGILHAVPELENCVISRFDYAKEILTYFSDDKRLAGVKLVPVERASYWPWHSTMQSSFNKMTWKEDLRRFMSGNDELRKFLAE